MDKNIKLKLKAEIDKSTLSNLNQELSTESTKSLSAAISKGIVEGFKKGLGSSASDLTSQLKEQLRKLKSSLDLNTGLGGDKIGEYNTALSAGTKLVSKPDSGLITPEVIEIYKDYNEELRTAIKLQKQQSDEAVRLSKASEENARKEAQARGDLINAIKAADNTLAVANNNLKNSNKIMKDSAVKEYTDRIDELSKKLNIAKDMDESTIKAVRKKTEVIRSVRNELQVYNRDLRQSTKDNWDFGKAVKEQIKNLGTYLTASKILNVVIQVIRKAIQTVIELDKAFTGIRMVTGYNDEQMNQLKETYAGLAQQLSVTTKEVAEAGEEWLRQGLSVEETNKALTTSIKFAKVAQLSTTEATKLLTSAMRGYGLQVRDLLSIADKLNAVDMAAAVSASDLAKAMSETAATAKQAGISMDYLIGALGAVQQASQDSAESVGNAMKSILSRMQKISAGVDVDEYGESLNDVDTVLKKYDISLRKTDGTMRNMEVVLDEIASKWNKLTNTQQSQIATAVAGTRQAEKFRLLMAEYPEVLDLATKSMESLGTTTNKYGAYIESVEASQNALTASFEKFSTDAINSGTVNGLLKIVTALLNLLDAVESLLHPFQIIGDVIEQIQLSLNMVIKPLTSFFNLIDSATDNTAGKIIESLVNPFTMLHEILVGTNKALKAVTGFFTHLFGGKTQEEIDAVKEKIDNLGSSYDQYIQLVSQGELSKTQQAELDTLKKNMKETSEEYRNMLQKGMNEDEAYYRANIQMRAKLASSIGERSYLSDKNVEDALVQLQMFYGNWSKLDMSQKKLETNAFEETIDNVEKLAEKYPELKSWIDEITKSYKDQIEAAKDYDPLAENIKQLKKLTQAEKTAWEEKKKQLEEEQELEEKILAVQEKQKALAEAERKRVKVYRAGKGFVYESDFSGVSSAKKDLAKAQKDLEEYQKGKSFDKQIESYEKLEDAEESFWKNSENGWKDWYNENAKLFSDTVSTYEEMIKRIQDISKLSGISLDNTEIGNIVSGSIETHHKGGVVGASSSTYASSDLKTDEVIAKLQKGEIVLSRQGKNNLVKNFITKETNGSNIVNVGNITLPNVSNAEQFVNELKSIGRMSLQKAVSHK